MGRVLKFSLREARSAPVTAKGHTAKIILFMGVRYERATAVCESAQRPQMGRTRKG